jgi:antitoxin component of MazEF toxin-antitoxin module
MLKGTGRVVKTGKARTLFVTIPSDLVKDSAFPLSEGDQVEIRIEGEELRIRKTDSS